VLLVSPLAEGLFHRAILQSGVPVAVRIRLREGDEAGERQGQTVFQNLGVKNVAEARRKSATEVLGAIRAKVGLLDMGAGTKYGPIVDGWVLPDLPMKRLAAGQFHRVPVLAGSNADEATMFSDRVSVRSELGYRLAVRAALGRDADEVLKVFPPDYADSPKATFEKLVTVMSFVSPARMLVRLASRHQPDTYLYHFTRVPAASARLGKGATHGIEIPFVFQWGGLVLAGPKDRELARSMHRCWVQFAHRGDPNGEGLPEWPRYDAATDRHLEFGDEVRVGTQLYQQECDLFERLARREWER
jgi:para-nitrobenzyl esterase